MCYESRVGTAKWSSGWPKLTLIWAPFMLQHFFRAVIPRSPHHASARMRARTAEIEALNRRAVARPAGYRTHHEHLVQAHLAVENVAAGDAETPFQVERRQHLAMLHKPPDVGGVLLDQRHHPVAERLAKLVPGALTQRIGRVL